MKKSLMFIALGLAVASAPPAFAQHDGHTMATNVAPVADAVFTLRTAIADGKLVFVGDAGAIKDQVNPDINVAEGKVVQINLVNGDGALHDITVPDFDAKSDRLSNKGASTTIVFRATKSGTFEYFCSLPGHKAAGMVGKLTVGSATAAVNNATEISQDPTKTGTPVGKRGPQNLEISLTTKEIDGRLSDGSSYRYWTFDNTVPGPFLRIRKGDTVKINLSNAPDSVNIHSIDFHAVTGPGGGAAVTQVAPGQTKSFTFKAMNPGLYVYHCATPMVAHHISNGMYGMILVEPEGGLPKVDREFYVMQGELYTAQKHGSSGMQEFSLDKLLEENPEHITFNGAMDALTKTHKMEAKVGETVRIFFGVGGPNLTSSFHVIGEIFDRVYNLAALDSPPLRDVQTTVVPPGGATMVEFKVEYPGKYILVDHALSRMEKGLVGFLHVTGDKDDSVFKTDQPLDPKSGH